MKKPNLFIVGAPKAGTTTLHSVLDKHEEIFMSNPKEVNYFSHEELANQSIYYNPFTVNSEKEYLRLFAEANETHSVIGEASVSYLFYPNVPGRLHEFNPNSKIIISLRNPIDRAYSHYLMDKRLGFVKPTFDKIVSAAMRGEKNIFIQQYLELGNYFNQVKRYLDTFPKNQVCIIFFQDLKNQMNEVMHGILSSLELEKYRSNSKPKILMWSQTRKYMEIYTPRNG